MAQNHIQEGAAMPYSNNSGSGIASGEVVVVGNRIGVALGDIPDGGDGQLAMGEVWELPKLSTDDMATVGTAVYWDATEGNITLTATANTMAGHVFRPAGVGVDTVEVKINA